MEAGKESTCLLLRRMGHERERERLFLRRPTLGEKPFEKQGRHVCKLHGVFFVAIATRGKEGEKSGIMISID